MSATVTRPELTWQASLLAAVEVPAFDASFAGVDRRELAHGAWVDHLPGWLAGADELFARVLDLAPWGQRTEQMYGEHVLQPRLTARWHVEDVPPEVTVLGAVGAALSDRYGVRLGDIGINLYRDGRDSVAWHGDRIARDLPTATIAIVSLGHRAAVAAASTRGRPQPRLRARAWRPVRDGWLVPAHLEAHGPQGRPGVPTDQRHLPPPLRPPHPRRPLPGPRRPPSGCPAK